MTGFQLDNHDHVEFAFVRLTMEMVNNTDMFEPEGAESERDRGILGVTADPFGSSGIIKP
jgi:hypothetical protein